MEIVMVSLHDHVFAETQVFSQAVVPDVLQGVAAHAVIDIPLGAALQGGGVAYVGARGFQAFAAGRGKRETGQAQKGRNKQVDG